MGKITVKNIAYCVASSFYIGKIPFAPGTWGSLAGLGLCFLLKDYTALYVSTFLVLFFAGVVSSGIVEKSLGEKDPSVVVIDETASIFPVFFLVPLSLFTAIVGFALYRLFDIFKPFPADRMEHIKGGWGIMLDDLVAGIYSAIILLIIKMFV